MKFFDSNLQYMLILVFIMIVVILLSGLKFTYRETFTDQSGCKVIGLYTIEKCGHDVKVNTVIKDEQPSEKNSHHCPSQWEEHELGCQLKCPSNTFLLSNPEIGCQHVITGQFTEPIEGHCPSGFRLEAGQCSKMLTDCPKGFQLMDGVCIENCSDGSNSTNADVEIETGNDTVHKTRMMVCRKPSKSQCLFPYTEHEMGANTCQLRCPTTEFLMDNPTLGCRNTVVGESIEMKNDGSCPENHVLQMGKCYKKLTKCPSGYTLTDGLCTVPCPSGTSLINRKVQILDAEGQIKEVTVPVCQKHPEISTKN